MTLTHYIGGKLVGQTADFPPSLNYPNLTTFINSETFTEYILVGGVWEQIGGVSAVGGWKEVARTTLAVAGDLISVPGISNKRYYMVLTDKRADGDAIPNYTINNDNTNNYSQSLSIDGSSDTTKISQPNVNGLDPLNTRNSFGLQYITNLSNKQKLVYGWIGNQGNAGAGNDPKRSEFAWKWTDTVNAVSRIDITNPSTGSYGIGSECVVLEWDPQDTHTDNFWEELANVTLGSLNSSLDSGVFTSKKYIWFQAFCIPSGTINSLVRVGKTTIDTGNNYAWRTSVNGGTDSTFINDDKIAENASPADAAIFINGFIINNASNEKITITHMAEQNSAGAGFSPDRDEVVGKWTNTTDQIDRISIDESQAGSFNVGSTIKVWGHD